MVLLYNILCIGVVCMCAFCCRWRGGVESMIESDDRSRAHEVNANGDQGLSWRRRIGPCAFPDRIARYTAWDTEDMRPDDLHVVRGS